MKNMVSMIFMVVLLSTITLSSQAIQPRISNTEEKGNETRSKGNTEFSNVVQHVIGHVKSSFGNSCKVLGTLPPGKVCVCKPLISVRFIRNTCFFVSEIILTAESATQAARNSPVRYHSKSQKRNALLKSLTHKISNSKLIGDYCNPHYSAVL